MQTDWVSASGAFTPSATFCWLPAYEAYCRTPSMLLTDTNSWQ